jgi:hypothetical protein
MGLSVNTALQAMPFRDNKTDTLRLNRFSIATESIQTAM